MEISPDLTLGDLASEMEAVIPYFEEWKLDYTLEGDRTLREACEDMGIPLAETLKILRSIQMASALDHHWQDRPLAELVAYLLQRHHPYTRLQMGKVEVLLQETIQVYGLQQPALLVLKELFLEMASEIRGHMAKEEEIVFPYLIQREEAEKKHESLPDPFLQIPFFREPIRILQWEHRMTGEEWAQVHLLTDGYRLPENAHDSLQFLYWALKELKEDIHQHVHLENNILFHRAVEKGWLQ